VTDPANPTGHAPDAPDNPNPTPATSQRDHQPAPATPKRKGRPKDPNKPSTKNRHRIPRTDGKPRGTDRHNPNRPRTGRTGRPAYVPSPEDIEQVKTLAAYGLSKQQISAILGVSEETFNKNRDVFLGAMNTGLAVAAGRVGQSLYEQAVGGSLGHIVWWEKTRMGRSDRVVVENTGAGGGPIETTATVEHTGEVHTTGRIALYLPSNGRGDVVPEPPTDAAAATP
jgi:transposase-like protein